MKSEFWDFFKFTLIAVITVLLIRTFIAQPFIVSGNSMEPTFDSGDYLIVDELTYRFSEPQKNDVVIFKYPLDPSKFFIKRIIGLPGETIHFEGRKITLGEKEYFVMGDNRPNSSDSRKWGALKEDFLVGKAFLRLWPLNKIGVSPGKE